MGKRSIQFNKETIDSLPRPEVRTDYFANDRSGLAVRVSPKLGPDGKPGKVFYLVRRIGGRLERIKLGTYGQITVAKAKELKDSLGGKIAEDQNPAEVKRLAKGEATFKEAFDRYLVEKKNRKGIALGERTLKEYLAIFKLYLVEIGKKKLSKVTPQDVRVTHSKIGSDSQRNKVKNILDAVYLWAGPDGVGLTESRSPAKSLKVVHIEARRRILKPDELGRFIAAVTDLDSDFRDAFLIAAGTGARKSNVLGMRWAHLDLKAGTWAIPGELTKNRETTVLPLHRKVTALLRLRQKNRLVGAEYVFPGTGGKGHLVEPKSAWKSVLDKAGIKDLRLHDVRRSVGSYAAMNGASLRQVGSILGQKSPQASAIYSEIAQESARATLDASIDAMLSKVGGRL